MVLKVAVIFGGRSVEHEISVISAMQCIAAIDKEKYSVQPIYISKKGEWYVGEVLSKLENYKDMDKLLAAATKILCSQNTGQHEIYKAPPCGLFGSKLLGKIDVIFPVIHGTNGEDGTLQGLFELMNIPYVGCNVGAAAATMDKVLTKFALKDLDIPTLDYMWFYAGEWIADKDKVIANIKKKFAYPIIVKPANLGSSIGVSSVQNDEELENAVDLAISMAMRVMVEPKVQNLKEVNCGVLGDHDQVETSVLEEPLRSEHILSYQDKYMGGGKGKSGAAKTQDAKDQGMSGAKRKIPAEVSEEVAAKIHDYAKRAFLGLDCAGVARVDFLIDKNTGNIYLCELNTIPGSLSFYLWQPKGKDFTVLTDQLIQLALKRHRDNSNLIFSYATNILALQSKGKS